MSKASTFSIALALFGAGLGFLGYQLHRQNQLLERLEALVAARSAAVDEILGEVTRMRIEQRAEEKGVAGLLEKLAAYAPLLTSASTTDPAYQNARKEMRATLRAFAALGKDAWPTILDRLQALDPKADYDECRWLIEAAAAVDQEAGIELARKVVLGLEKPNPRLRRATADLLMRLDLELAQRTMRQILLTESFRGVNLDRAQAYGATIPDQAALANNGFFNFVVKYVQTKDPETEDTLLMVMSRAEHDLVTVQECVKALGELRCERAVELIERFFRKPPGGQYNPLFRNHCLEALAAIQGDQARPFFEAALREEADETVKKRLEHLLAK